MRHRVAGRKFSLPSDQRKALLRGLVRSLFEHGKIQTTETRAKEVRPIAEKLITLAKRNDVHSRRLVRQYVDSSLSEFAVNAETRKIARNPNYVVHRLFEQIAPGLRARQGGYTRITRIGCRRGDAATIVQLEIVEGETVTPKQAEAAPAAEAKKRGSRSKATSV